MNIAIRNLVIWVGVCAAALMLHGGAQAQGGPAPEWRLAVNNFSEQSQKPAYTLNASYPVLEAPDGKAEAFNRAVEAFLAQAVSEFKTNAEAAETMPGPAGTASSLEMSYDLYATSRGMLSLRFSVTFYIRGAAHPAAYSSGLTYDMIEGRVLALADMFQPGANYLDVIANYCIKELQKQDRLLFPDGAAARPENYARWNVERTGILITFDAYQVGPYAQGPSEVLVPYSALASILRIPG